ncbi:hypothetical protein QVD17_02256 [Tagetes erecta]|uniref:Uncharacterized protein n=1 Tax=Tagetes erecta TaxID=13708 RepID=A0AAD8LC36_TARER|nr:hypothetical protein QVD17_02256 [Tagetes erecta]
MVVIVVKNNRLGFIRTSISALCIIVSGRHSQEAATPTFYVHDNLEKLNTLSTLLLAKITKIVSMTKDGMLGKHRIEDIRWLCSLSESELDLVISLKKMATRRQSLILKKKSTQKEPVTSHKSLSKKFDLKMLRDLTFVLMQVLKEQLADVTQTAGSRVDNSSLIKYEISEEFREMGVEELMAYIRPDRKKRISMLFGIDDMVTNKNKRARNG